MEKIDHKKELKHLYKPSAKKVEFVEVPAMNYLMLDGKGDPNTAPAYSEAVESLFKLSYTIKFLIKKSELEIDYKVMPLEGLWWVENMENFDPTKKDDWFWTSLMMQPDLVTEEHVNLAKEQVLEKKKLSEAALEKIRFERFEEGKCAQVMHIGPFSEEGPTIEKLHQHIFDNNFKLTGKHHEIYLSDIRRAKPEKWKTIIRQAYE